MKRYMYFGLCVVILSLLSIFTDTYLAQEAFPTIGYAVQWSPNGDKVALVGDSNNVWILNSDFQIVGYITPTLSGPISWSPDSSKLAIGTEIWNAITLERLLSIEGEVRSSMRSKQWGDDNRTIALDNGLNILLYDTTTGEVATAFSGSVEGQWIVSADWSPDETRFAVSRADRSIAIFDVATGEITAVYPQQEIVDAITWSPDSTLFAGIIAEFVSNDTPGSIPTAGQNILVSIYLWDAVTGEVVQTISGLGEYANMLRWNPNGNELASGAPNGLVEIWDVNTGQQITSLLSSGILNGMDYSPYGARLAFANNPTTLEYSVGSRAAEVVVDYDMQSLANGALDIVVPAPSLERLQAIQSTCMTAPAVGQMDTQALTVDALPEYVAQVEALTDAEIPPGCAADLVAVAEALIAEVR